MKTFIKSIEGNSVNSQSNFSKVIENIINRIEDLKIATEEMKKTLLSVFIVAILCEKLKSDKLKILAESSIISIKADLSFQIYVGSNAIINSKSVIEVGCIINSGSIIEHQCIVKSFSHIAPGAILCGNVSVGHNSFIGSSSVVLPNLTIGNNVIVGAGSVITKNIPSNSLVFGNPGKIK